MASIKRFEDMQAWQKAREFTSHIYRATGNGWYRKDHCLKDQTRRAAVSIMLNIAEGFGRKTDKEFSKFLVQAHGSCAEVQAALYIALDQTYVSQEQFKGLYDAAGEISRMVMGLHKHLSATK